MNTQARHTFGYIIFTTLSCSEWKIGFKSQVAELFRKPLMYLTLNQKALVVRTPLHT